MERVRIFACTIKQYKQLEIDGYETLHMGSALRSEDFSPRYIKDTIGENISERQPYYCELAGLYWMWKNVHDAEIVGLCHYRRYFVMDKYTVFAPKIVNSAEARKILNEYDIIVPEKLYKSIENGWTKESSSKDDWYVNLLIDIVSEIEPQYESALRNVFSSEKMSFANLVITRKNVLDEYCEWLFKILFELEKRLIDSNRLAPRNVGYAAEWLFNAWLEVNAELYKIKYQDVIKTDDKRGTQYFLKVLLSKMGILDNLLDKKHERQLKKAGINTK